MNSFVDMNSTPIHKTNILPLRWFANWCNHLSAKPLWNAIFHEDCAKYTGAKLSIRGRMWWKIYRIVDTPYRKWGTTYLVDWHR
jgi:hypothetical protein